MREISRLRLKFILYNMLVVTAVIALTFCVVTFVVKHKISRQSSLALSQVAAGKERPMIFGTLTPSQLPYFSIIEGKDGMVTAKEVEYASYLGQEFLERMAALGMAREEAMGILDGYHLRYLRITQPGGHIIAFADTSYEDALSSGVITCGGLACAVIWLGFFALSYVFSGCAVKPVEESICMQKQFVADASHELKTPLTIITANAELLQEQYAGISSEADKWLEHVNQECREMRTLVESLLLLAKNDAGISKKKDFRRFSFSDLVMERLLIFEPVFYQEEKGLEYRIEEGVEIMGNPDQMGQMLKALIDNVVKYSVPRGRTEVKLELIGRRRARLWINSQGEPIPEDKRRMIFRRFYRDDSARSRSSGYGLGLAIAAEAARSHKARIGVEYRDGMNCFWVIMKILT